MTLPVEPLSNVAVPIRFPEGDLTAHKVVRRYTTVQPRTGRPIPEPAGYDPKKAAAGKYPEHWKADVARPACDPSTDAMHTELMSSTARARGAVPCNEPECFPGLVADQADEPGEPDVDRTARALGIRPDDKVWIASARRGIEAHRTDGPLTGCGRSTRTGERLDAAIATASHQVRWCRKCWPKTR